MAPEELWARYQKPKPDSGEISHIQLLIEVKEQKGGKWDCAKITETVQQVVGKVDAIPQDPFTIFALVCNAAFGLGGKSAAYVAEGW